MKHLVCMVLTMMMLVAATAGFCGAALSESPAQDAQPTSGSWAQINQSMERPDNWQSYVENSLFTLGSGMPMEDYPEYTLLDWGTYPSIDGSTVCVPLGMELARQHLGISEEDLPGFVTFSTTHNAYMRLIEGKPNPTVSIASQYAVLDPDKPVNLFLGTEPSDEELQIAADAGVELVKVPFCYDAFVFLVNGKNPVDSLTVKEIQQIYSGSIIQWGDVGGESGKLIRAYQRPTNSGSQTAMENLVMKGVALSGAEDAYITDGMSDLIAVVGDYENGPQSLGYSYLYYVEGMYKSGEVKVLAVDGIAPSEENLRSGAYPFTTCYYAVYRKGDTDAEAFAAWLTGEEGQQCVRQAGYIPVLNVP
ncbi:MAG: substrate-binding domain-containing protein [Clostridia bacterium]|nr:substrate-binding domain-containing protein [Clostridia bacterium]MBP3650567.1 substrate-binding domain-containing protein [Clostridia bacterium]